MVGQIPSLSFEVTADRVLWTSTKEHINRQQNRIHGPRSKQCQNSNHVSLSGPFSRDLGSEDDV